MGAVAEQTVDLVGDGLEGGRVGGGAQVGDDLLAHGGRDVEFLLAAGGEEELDDGVEFGAVDASCGGVEGLEVGHGGFLDDGDCADFGLDRAEGVG